MRFHIIIIISQLSVADVVFCVTAVPSLPLICSSVVASVLALALPLPLPLTLCITLNNTNTTTTYSGASVLSRLL